MFYYNKGLVVRLILGTSLCVIRGNKIEDYKKFKTGYHIVTNKPSITKWGKQTSTTDAWLFNKW